MNILKLKVNLTKNAPDLSFFNFKIVKLAQKKTTVLILLLFVSCFSSFAITTETVDSLINENRELSVPFKLHITSVDTPLVNSTINLTHEDAWVFFDNIRPSVIISKYLN